MVSNTTQQQLKHNMHDSQAQQCWFSNTACMIFKHGNGCLPNIAIHYSHNKKGMFLKQNNALFSNIILMILKNNNAWFSNLNDKYQTELCLILKHNNPLFSSITLLYMILNMPMRATCKHNNAMHDSPSITIHDILSLLLINYS